MSRVGFSIAIMIIVGLVTSGAATAQTPPPAPQSTMAVPPELDAKIKKDVKERAEKRKKIAAKRAECNKQAKEQNLGPLGRKKFVGECMAK
jgi:Skp family chaperone for outer membrane proteins